MDSLKNVIIAENVSKDISDISDQISKLWNKAKFIAEGSLSDVYLSENEKYIFKVQERSEILIREFKVGLQLNKIDSPYLTQYYCYGEGVNRNRPFALIVMEYVKGQSYYDTMEKLNLMEKKILTKHVIYILAELNSIKFTHYDLHGDNIIVEMGPLTDYSFKCFGKEYAMQSYYRIKFIDYDLSYVDGIEPLWLRDIDPKTIITGCVSDLYDDFYDLAYFLTCYCIFEKIINHDLINLIKTNSFYAYTLDEPLDKIFEYGRELYPEWAILGKDLYRPLFDNYYCGTETKESTVVTFVQDAVQRMKKHLKLNDMRRLSKTINSRLQNPGVSDIVDNIGKEFGSVMRWNKMEQMRKRTVTVEQLFNSALVLFE